MKKALRYARLSLWIVGFACLTWFLIVYTPWYKLFPEDHSKSAATGQPLVKAIYAYRNEHGLWPDGTEPFFAE